MDNERKLAHIEIITDLKQIQGADKIEVACVLGWECEMLNYPPMKSLLRATNYRIPLSPNCFIPRVVHRHF